MIERPRRSWLAIVLVVVAVAAPCTAWYVVGSASAEREAAALRARPIDRGHEIARALADRLVGRLQAMRDSESARPHYHFQSHYEDPTTACSCAAATPSPLATGPQDPFIDLYFQIDPDGQMTVPILDDPGDLLPDADRFQRATEGHEAILPHVATLRRMATSGRDPLLPSTPIGTTLSSDFARRRSVPEIEAFQWHGLEDVAEPALVALRRLGNEGAVQGFVLASSAVSDWLRSAELPAVLRPLSPQHVDSTAFAEVPLDCTTWEIAVDVREPVALAGVDASRIEGDFLRSFLIGSIAASIAALSVILLLLNAERVARQRSQFAAAAAHELRTPLAGLRMYGEMLTGASGDPEKTARYAARIASESERLSRVVTNVLDFTRLERGNVSTRVEVADVGAALRSIATRLELVLRGQGATLVVDIADDLPLACFDPDALDHVVQNLVDNAEKYSRESEDRRVELGASVEGSGDESAGGSSAGSGGGSGEGSRSDSVVVVRVRDHGPGVAADVARTLFEPFARGTDPDQPAGLGLGLALVKRLVLACGGTVAWRNLPEGGAEFSVRLVRGVDAGVGVDGGGGRG